MKNKRLVKLTEFQLRKIITESIKNIICENINDEVEECRDLLDTIGDMDTREKKAIAAKYGITSPKTEVLKDFFAKKLRELRHSKTTFDERDFDDFLSLNVNLKTIAQLIEQEPIGMKDVILKGIEKFCSNTLSGQRWYKIYFKAEETYYTSKAFMTDKQKTELEQKENSVEQLIEKLTSLLEDYKGGYLKRVEVSSRVRYHCIPDEMQRLKDSIEEMHNIFDAKKRNKEFQDFYESFNFLNKINKLEEKYHNYNHLITNKYPTVDTFVQDCIKMANEEFESKTSELAHRVIDKGFDIHNIQLNSIQDDPKVFSLRITDGKQTLFCRSILAAEFSDKMVPHFRFIITKG